MMGEMCLADSPGLGVEEYLRDHPRGDSEYALVPLELPKLRAMGVASVNKPRFPIQNFATLLTEKQLREEHGLNVVGGPGASQWLIPESFRDTEHAIAADWQDAFDRRIGSLREVAKEEGLPFSEASVVVAASFKSRLGSVDRPSIFLVGNGNVRFVWHHVSGAQVGFQFLPSGRIQYVMIGAKRNADDKAFGEGDAASVLRLLKASNFSIVVFGR